MTSSFTRGVILLGSATLFGVLACSRSTVACYPGDYVACACGGAAPQGVSQCNAAGEAYGACDCSGAVIDSLRAALDASAAEASAPEASALVPFLGACEKNEQCSTGLCFPFNAAGPHCSHPCKVASDCEAPSPGCSNFKVCKIM